MLELCPKKRVVVTIHGIMTTGRWQKEVTTALSENGLIPVHIHYGIFDPIRFIFPFTREKQINTVRSRLRKLFVETGTPLHIVAHSFGTLIAMEALTRECGELKYDRIILSGCILRRNFPWSDLFKKGWIRAVRNERADGDWVVTLAFIASKLRFFTRLNGGDSGRHAFTESHPQLIDRHITGEHSTSHNQLKYDRWAKFLSYPKLSQKLLEKMKKELQLLRQEVSSVLNIDPNIVRSNLFALFDDVLHLVPGACVNMNHAPEYHVTIEPGHGGTGKAFMDKNPLLVVNSSGRWSHDLPGDELAKVCPDLKWILSLPVYSAQTGISYGVVNIDGLHTLPEKLKEDPAAVLFAMQMSMEGRITSLMELAFEGMEYSL